MDEFPDMVEGVTISERDIGELHVLKAYPGHEWLAPLAERVLIQWRRLTFYEHPDASSRFIAPDQIADPVLVNELRRITRNEKPKSVLKKFLMFAENGAYFSERCFHTVDTSIQPRLLKQNILLDACAGFDKRYEVSDKYNVWHQPKHFEYSRSTLFHYPVNTSKKALGEYVAFFEQALGLVSVDGHKVLFIVDKERKETLEQVILSHYGSYGHTMEDIQAALNCTLAVDYFSNLVGRNEYRDFSKVVVLKTPNSPYVSYVQNAMYYTSVRPSDIRKWIEEDVQDMRDMMVAVELYQGVKRINRDNSKDAEYHIFSANEVAVQKVRDEMPGIKYERIDMRVKKRVYNMTSRSAKSVNRERMDQIRGFLLEQQEQGVSQIRKKSMVESLEIPKKSLAPLLLDLEKEGFLAVHGIKNEGQKLILDAKRIVA